MSIIRLSCVNNKAIKRIQPCKNAEIAKQAYLVLGFFPGKHNEGLKQHNIVKIKLTLYCGSIDFTKYLYF